MKLTKAQVAKLRLDPQNARKHGETDIAAIKASLTRFGQQTPIVVDADNVVVKGNGTLMAAMALGWKSVDIIKTVLTGDQLRAYAIADNQTGLLSKWDDAGFALAVAGLEEQFRHDMALGLPEPPKPKAAKVSVKPPTFSVRINGVSQEHKDAVVDILMSVLEEGGYAYSAAAY